MLSIVVQPVYVVSILNFINSLPWVLLLVPDNELEEIKLIEDQYITALAANSAMTKRYIKNRLKKRLNVYIGAEEAVELGIADIIL